MTNYYFGLKITSKLDRINTSINRKLTIYVVKKERPVGRRVANYYFGIKIAS